MYASLTFTQRIQRKNSDFLMANLAPVKTFCVNLSVFYIKLSFPL